MTTEQKFERYLNAKKNVFVVDAPRYGVYTLEAVFEEEMENEDLAHVIKEEAQTTEDHQSLKTYMYLGETKTYNLEKFKEVVIPFVLAQKRESLQVNLKSFAKEKVDENDLFFALYEALLIRKHKGFSLKTLDKNKDKDWNIFIITTVDELQDKTLHVEEVAYACNFARYFQLMPPNMCNSEYLSQQFALELSENPKIEVKVLDKNELQEKGLNLLLSVNRGSMYEAKMVVAEYKGEPDSKEKLVLVGKGITFDSGGYSIKPSSAMIGMKFDMSGAAIVAATLQYLAKTGIKKNVSVVMPLTDNRVNGDASTPDSVWTSYDGKTVEINNTDAEGRLILADALAYGVKDLEATTIVSVATLTGAMLYALGTTFTGFWSTKSKNADLVRRAAKFGDELVWEMPLHKDFLKDFKKSQVADLLNTNYVTKAGSSAAAMFLKEFVPTTVDYVHFDIAGTADIGGEAKSPLIKTLAVFSKLWRS